MDQAWVLIFPGHVTTTIPKCSPKIRGRANGVTKWTPTTRTNATFCYYIQVTTKAMFCALYIGFISKLQLFTQLVA
jgi:hypothetical protein